MKLWLLKPQWRFENNEVPRDENPWKPWYDKAFGFVVRAETASEARAFADEQTGDESREIAETSSIRPWLSDKYTSCEELTAVGEVGIVLQDFKSA